MCSHYETTSITPDWDFVHAENGSRQPLQPKPDYFLVHLLKMCGLYFDKSKYPATQWRLTHCQVKIQ